MSRKHRKFKGFFRPKLGALQKKKKKRKKKVFAKIQSDFSPKFRKFKRLRGGSFRMGGAIFHFSQKIGLKSTKYMRFCILHKPMGKTRAPPAPPPGYATAFFPLNWFATDLSIHRNCRPLAPGTMAALLESFSENHNCT